jgi:anti-sigma B factor antagonist
MNAETGGLNHAMQVEFLEEGERLIARPHGRMDAADGIHFASAVQQRLHAGTKSVTIDLEELDFVDLGGVRAILRLARSLKGGQKSLDFVRGGHAVREALDQAGFHDFFPFTPPFHSHRGHHDETP